MKIPGLVLSICVVACGSGGDGGVDGGDGPGALTEVVALDDRSWGDPTPGLTVVFTEEGRTQTAVTDDAGRAAVALRGPATVTVIRPPDGLGFPLTSVVGVMPGERVVFGLADHFDPVRTSMVVEVPPFEGGLGRRARRARRAERPARARPCRSIARATATASTSTSTRSSRDSSRRA
jgi:hypothetical protein